jgi:DNA-directed RNA polymerase alpha subunit
MSDEDSIKTLGLSTRSTNALLQWQIETIGKLKDTCRRDLTRLPNIGRVSIAEIEATGLLREETEEDRVKDREWRRSLRVYRYGR